MLWVRFHQSGHAVFAGCGDLLSGLRRFPVCKRGKTDPVDLREKRTAYNLPELMDMSVDEPTGLVCIYRCFYRARRVALS